MDIDAVTVEIRNIRTQQQRIIQLARGLLSQGLGNENSSQTITALQVSFPEFHVTNFKLFLFCRFILI